MDYSTQGSSVCDIFQVKILECMAISFFMGSSHWDQTHVSCIGKQILYHWVTRKAHISSVSKAIIKIYSFSLLVILISLNLKNQIPLAFKVKFPGGSQSLCWIPSLGNLLWALELSQQCENFFGRIVLQFVGCLLVALWWGSHAAPPRSAVARAPVPTAGHRWPVPLQETPKHTKAGLAGSLVGSKITADGDCSHEIKRHLLLGRKTLTNLDSILKSRDITLLTKIHTVKAMVFPVVMCAVRVGP